MTARFPILTLSPGRDVHLRDRHHAIFTSAVARMPDASDGSIVEVQASNGAFLCYAMFNRKAFLCARAIGFEQRDPMDQLHEAIERAVALRKTLFMHDDTDALRLINAEGDSVPGLIVDRYADTLVLQCTTLGMDLQREWLADALTTLTGANRIYEKSTGASRAKEGLEPREGWLKGEGATTMEIAERGVRYGIDLAGSQKTGLFLDQRDMRSLVRQYAKDRIVLDCCSYVGGFSMAALAGGAKSADAVDYDKQAIAGALENAKRNGVQDRFTAHTEDVFPFLRRDPAKRYDFVILDPPAFAKSAGKKTEEDLSHAEEAYGDLNRLALEIIQPGGLLLTCSCSYQITQDHLQRIVTRAALDVGRGIRLFSRHRAAADHPVNLYHPEGEYLKSMLLWVE